MGMGEHIIAAITLKLREEQDKAIRNGFFNQVYAYEKALNIVKQVSIEYIPDDDPW